MEQVAMGWHCSRGRITLELACVRMGQDLTVLLSGGDREHIGAMAVSQARPSLADPARTSASTSVITLLGHKEDDLAKAMASQLASSLGVAVCVVCGVHLDRITAEELGDVQIMAAELTTRLIAHLGQGS